MRALAWLAAITACYHDTGTAPDPGAAPLVIQPAPKCKGDDLEQPVVDVNPGGRLRTHTQGVLSGASGRTWAGPPVPPYVPTRIDTLELFIADDADGGILALYREPYNLTSCKLSGSTNCAYEVRHYDAKGRFAWSLRLADVMSMRDHLEVQDIRLAGGVLYFNEACQSYSNEAKGQCSRLVAVDPRRKQVLWRTDPLVSNGRFRVRGCYIVAGYGFTAEPDFVHLVDRATGKVLQTIAVSSSPEELNLVGSDRLDVTLYNGVTRHYRLDGFDAKAPKLMPLDPPEQFGGASYGGAAYGGATYGIRRP